MRKILVLAVILGVVNAGVCIWLIPFSNVPFQRYFDTGAPMSVSETRAFVLALIAAFPIAEWTMVIHPDRVSRGALITSAVLNGLGWGLCVCAVGAVIRRWMRHRRSPHNNNG